MQYEIFYDPKFDIKINRPHPYDSKAVYSSLYPYILNFDFDKKNRILNIGYGESIIATQALGEQYDITYIDQYRTCNSNTVLQVNLNKPWKKQKELRNFDTVFALDVIEHINNPEACIKEIFNAMNTGGKLYASTGNIGFFTIRIMLLFGSFNYSRRGILDLTHTRLMTINSFKRLLNYGGFEVEKVVGFGPPLDNLKNYNILLKFLKKILSYFAHKYPSLFAFHFLLICTKKDDFQDIVNITINTLSAKK